MLVLPSMKSYTSLIRSYTSQLLFDQSLASFMEMRASGVWPNENIFPSVLKSCACSMNLRLGESLHACIIRLGCARDLFTGNALLNMYCKFADAENGLKSVVLNHERKVYDESSKWGLTVCTGSSSKVGTGGCHLGLDSYQHNGNFTGIIVNEVSKVECPTNKAKYLDSDHYARSHDTVGLLDMDYATGEVGYGTKSQRCRLAVRDMISFSMDNATRVFVDMPTRDVVSWNTIIAGYAQKAMFIEALLILRQMAFESLKPDSFTLSSILPVFAQYVNVAKGKEIHAYAVRHLFHLDVFIGSSLIDMYAKCNILSDSSRVFNLLPEHDAVSWNSIIAGYVQNGFFYEGLNLFRQMLLAKIKPRHVTFSSLLPACAHPATLHLGKNLHCYIIRQEYDDNVFITSSLVDMYAKCGYLLIAQRIFDRMEVPDMVSWTTLIMGYALHGRAHEALSLFQQMENENVRPNYVAFVAVLTACSHAGLVDEAWKYFSSMSDKYGISPGLEHYAAVADLLGRAGRLSDAYKFISNMKVEPSESVWSTLLSACRVHKNVELAEKVVNKIFELKPEHIGSHLLMSSIYSAGGRWADAAHMRRIMRGKGLRKSPACSWSDL